MQPDQTGRLRRPVELGLFLAASAVVWWGLDRAEPRADWLRVEAPHCALAGQPLPIRVHLAAPTPPGYLCADLHSGNSRDRSMGFLAAGDPIAVGKGDGSFDFEIMVPARPGLRYVIGVVYMGRTANWGDHKLAALTELIPVVSGTAFQGKVGLEQLRLRPLGEGSRDHPRQAVIPRWLTGLLFLAAMIMALGDVQSANGPNTVASHGNRWWQLLVVLLALACLWEWFGLESWLGERARAIARARDLYYSRAVFQKVVISAAVAATILSLLFIRRRRDSRRLLGVFLALYLAISAVNLVSLHAIDQVADLSWRGLTLVQALKLVCAAMILLGVRRGRGA